MGEQRYESVRGRVEAVFGSDLKRVGLDYMLPGGRRLLVCYSKSHHGHADFYLGLPNRLRPNDVLVLLLDEKHVVLPRAELLLGYKEEYSRSNDGRLIPRIGIRDGKLILRLPRKDLIIPLEEYVDAYDSLTTSQSHIDAGPRNIGRPFEPADENINVSSAAPFVVDADLVGRGVRAHARTLNALANHLEHLGIQPLRPQLGDPPFDLGWKHDGILYIAEVKSLTRDNEEHQLRLGLGQVLRYRQMLRRRIELVTAALVPELKPSDSSWGLLCRSLDLRLAYPPDFSGLNQPD